MRQRRLPLSIAFSALLLAGCASVPTLKPAGQPLAAADVGLHPGIDVQIAPDWWTAMGDPQLDRLMADALAGNPTLAQAQARLRQAQASLAVNRAGQLPQLGVDGEETRERFSEKYIIPPPYGGSTQWVGSTQANLSWALDLAGRQAALVDQARADVNAVALDGAAARVTIAGAVAQAYVDLIRADRQIAIAQDFRASREESVRLAQSRVRNQLASQFDIRAAETLLAEARQAQVRAEGDRALIVHALAALAGRGADYYAGIGAPTLTFDKVMPVPDALPADLLGRRPDLLAALARVDAANAGRRVARADFYPNVDLKAFLGVQAIGLGALFTGGALTYGGGPAIHLPLFEGGRLKAGYEGATAQVDLAIAQYNGLVLGAVREAADALSAIQTAQADAAEQKQVLASLNDTVRLDQTRLRTGLGSQLDTIASAERLLQAGQAQVNIAADGATRRIQLVVALGGGFDPLISKPSKAALSSDAGARP
ncbi:AdeC/AdeK/OprM family multidrug efflux complex outer membrane factor [soil metagenome]